MTQSSNNTYIETHCRSGILDVMGDSISLFELHARKSLRQVNNIDGDIRKKVTKNLKAVEQKELHPREIQLLAIKVYKKYFVDITIITRKFIALKQIILVILAIQALLLK